MKERFVDITYRRTFPVDADRAFAWLTDYQEDDPGRAGAVVLERRVVERTGDRIVLEGHNVNLGRHAKGRAEIQLFPKEHRWELTVTSGSGRGSRYSYQLTPTREGHARLVIHYRTAVRRFKGLVTLTLARPLIRRELARMWDGFDTAMRKDLGVA